MASPLQFVQPFEQLTLFQKKHNQLKTPHSVWGMLPQKPDSVTFDYTSFIPYLVKQKLDLVCVEAGIFQIQWHIKAFL